MNVVNKQYHLQRLVDAQHKDYLVAFNEIRAGKKLSHWMWYIFPQIGGLGFSETSKYYAIKDLNEAAAFLAHPILGPRLIYICNELLSLGRNDASKIFGSPDYLKLHSSMTLFCSVPDATPIFQLILDKFFNGSKDERTLERLTAAPGEFT